LPEVKVVHANAKGGCPRGQPLFFLPVAHAQDSSVGTGGTATITTTDTATTKPDEALCMGRVEACQPEGAPSSINVMYRVSEVKLYKFSTSERIGAFLKMSATLEIPAGPPL
jgi:hypothetical protein